jgi:thiamine biosynthesis lipoprotein
MNKKVKRSAQALFLLFLIIGTIYILRDIASPKEYMQTRGEIYGTTYNIIYCSRRTYSYEIFEKMLDVDQSMSMFNEKSTISKLNSNKTKSTDPMFREVFTLAQQVSEETGGAFDITVAPLVNAWGFGFKNKAKVTPQFIDSLKKLVGYQKVKLVGNNLEKSNPNIMLDCSAIAKGYSCDVVAKFLESKHIKNYLIEIGGEIRARGVNKDGDKWIIGIVKPTEKNKTNNGDLEDMLKISGVGIATSGNYRNFYYKGGKKFAHTIDPHTGYPVQHSLLSATVVAPTCAEADAYATAFMVMGFDKALKILEKHKELKAYFIYTDKNNKEHIKMSPELKKAIVY